MALKSSKKNLPICILEILKRYSDAEHPLSQKNIENYLKNDYGLEVDRKAIKRNLMNLVDCGFNIGYETVDRTTDDQEVNTICTGFYYIHDFTDDELRLLIDSTMFSSHIDDRQRQELVKKLENLSSTFFTARLGHVDAMKGKPSANKQIFYTISCLDEAITAHKKISFKYLYYGTDKKLHPKKRSDGSETYVVSPYRTAARDGKYYLICNFDGHDDVSNYRVDRIADVTVLDEPVFPFEKTRKSGGRPLDLEDYMEKHPY